MTDFERKLKHLSAKDWNELRPAWLEHIPEIVPSGSRPAETFAQNELLRREASSVQATGACRFNVSINPAFLLFHESVFLMHKAVRVSCAAAQQAVDGLPTWSISTAHQSSMMALRALLGLCGIAYVEIENQYFLVDTFPTAPKGRRARHATLTASNNEIQMLRVRERMGHHHWWGVLQRLLRTSGNRFDCWLYPFDPAFLHCDVHVLSRHRNLLHYGLAWFHEDLFDNQIIESFAGSTADAGDGVVDNLGEDTSNGTLTLNQVLLGNVLAMLWDLSRSSARVAQEFELMRETAQRFSNDAVDSWFNKLDTVRGIQKVRWSDSSISAGTSGQDH